MGQNTHRTWLPGAWLKMKAGRHPSSRVTGHRAPIGSSPLPPRMHCFPSPWQVHQFIPGLFQTICTTTEILRRGWFHAVLCHDPWQRGVTMIAVHSSVILMPCVGRALWSYFSPQEYFTSEHIGSNYSPLFCCPSQMNQGMHWRKALSSLLQLFVESWWGCYWSLHVIRNWASQEDGAVFYHIQEKNNFQSFLQPVWCWWQQ